MTPDEMDGKVLEAGFVYQAKWSREREGYVLRSEIPLTPFARGE
jgi:hypothetical protein